MKTSIIIVTFNKLEYTIQCIESIRKHTEKQDYKIIVVDNNSTDGTVDWLKKQGDIRAILNYENLGFPKGCNQGIMASEIDNDILLLNNDIIVTENWLNNLKECLYSNKNIGAVGPTTNSAAYYQTIDTSYKSLEELQLFALEFNRSDKSKWEERQKLIGFCILVKREALNKIGRLDEKFSPGNFEDDDYSIRLINEGYKLYLCKDTFIHHYGGVSFNRDDKYRELIEKNEKVFKSKWGFTSRENMNIYKRYGQFIKNNNMTLLELFCGTGSTGLYLKQNFDCEYYGYEYNIKAEAIAKSYLEILTFLGLRSNAKIFDLVFVSDVDKVYNLPLDKVLKNSAQFIFNLPIESLISEEINKKVENINNFIKDFGFVFSDGIKETDDKSGKDIALYLVYDNVGYKELYTNLKNIDLGIDVEEGFNNLINILTLNNFNIKFLFHILDKCIENKIDILNSLGVLCYENGAMINTIPIFNEALKYEEDNYMVLMNYSEVLLNLGEYDIALSYISKVKENEKSEAWKSLNNSIVIKRNFLRRVKFLIRRIEFKVEENEAIKEVIRLIKNKEINDNILIEIIDKDIINKLYVLNFIAIKAFEIEEYDIILPLLNKAYDINSQDIDTNYNLAYILNLIGEKSMALEYLHNLKEKNASIQELIKSIEGEMLC